MYLADLELEEFRSYRRLQFRFDPAGLRLAGDNASGKSTLLEAIMMLATTRSPRTNAERELINWQSGESFGVPPFARVRGQIERRDRPREIEISLQSDPARPNQVKKQIRSNGRPVRAVDAVGTLHAVLFSPEDIELISGSPAGRRRYLDTTISQLDASYMRALSRFGRVLEQRNSLLKLLAGAGTGARSRTAAEQLDFWDAELVAHGSAIIVRRQRFVRRLAELAQGQFAQLAGRGDLGVRYVGTLGEANDDSIIDADLNAEQTVVVRDYQALLGERRSEEFRRGASLVGPHRDDLEFDLGGVDVALFGSRGQQRLVVLAVKLGVAALMAETAGEPPVVMLDDVLSELDARHREWVLAAAAQAGSQLIVTATDSSLLYQESLAALSLATVTAGAITLASG